MAGDSDEVSENCFESLDVSGLFSGILLLPYTFSNRYVACEDLGADFKCDIFPSQLGSLFATRSHSRGNTSVP